MDDTGLIFPDTLTAITKHKNGTDGSLPFKYKNLSNSTTTTTAELFRDKFKFHQDIELDADLIDINGNTGTAGQVLSSLGTGNGVDWITPSSGTVTGSGTAGRVAFWNGGSSITSDPDLTFDNIYHEHYNYWSLTSLVNFFNQFEAKIFRSEKVDTHGGSLRIYVKTP